jgi:hypothetical protein
MKCISIRRQIDIKKLEAMARTVSTVGESPGGRHNINNLIDLLVVPITLRIISCRWLHLRHDPAIVDLDHAICHLDDAAVMSCHEQRYIP